MRSGIHSDEVVQLVKNRVSGATGQDGSRKLGLVVEGGAMRGAYSAGTLLGLDLIGGSSIFDCAYATSAGAINVAHFLTGVGHMKASTYHRALADGRFFSPWRMPRPADVDFVIDTVLREEMPLDIDLLASSRTPFKVALLNCEEAKGELRTIDAHSELVWNVLRAAIAMPVVYNKRIPLPGGTYVDGAMAIPYPLKAAIADGMTDIVVVLSRNPASQIHRRSLYEYLLWSIFFASWQQRLISVFEGWRNELRALNAMALGQSDDIKKSGVRILTIAPTHLNIRSSCMDKTKLRHAAISMAGECLHIFGSTNKPLLDLIKKGIV